MIDIDNLSDNALLKLNDIIKVSKDSGLAIIPVSRTAWFKGIKDGKFPAGVKLSERSVAWRAGDIKKLIASFGGEQ